MEEYTKDNLPAPETDPGSWEVDILYQVLSLLLGFIGLQIIAVLSQLVTSAIYMNLYPDPEAYAAAIDGIGFKTAINVSSYIILLAGFMLLLYKPLKPHLVKFKSLVAPFKGVAYGFLIMLLSALVGLIYQLLELNISDNVNEENVTLMMTSYPVWSFLAFVIAGPVVEELTYRLGLFGLVKRWNRLAAYAVTSLVFGLIHFDFNNANIINELLNLPFYVIAGVGLSFVYDIEGLHVSIYAHITNNLVSFAFSFIESGSSSSSSSALRNLIFR